MDCTITADGTAAFWFEVVDTGTGGTWSTTAATYESTAFVEADDDEDEVVVWPAPTWPALRLTGPGRQPPPRLWRRTPTRRRTATAVRNWRPK